nr:hypothetical protein [Tanacetum cinerariifolium]
DESPIRTLGDYSRPSHEGYQNTIELPDGNNVVPMRYKTIRIILFLKHGLISRTYSQKCIIMASILGSKSKSFMTISIPPQGEPSIKRLVDILSISDRRLIELENQVQRLMEAHLAPNLSVQVNKISSSYKAGGKWYTSKPEQNNLGDTYNPSWKSHPNLRLVDGIKSYLVGIIKTIEVHIGKLELLNDFYVINMEKDPATLLLIGRGFLATANSIIDYKKAKIAVGEGVTRSIFRVKEINLGEEEAKPSFIFTYDCMKLRKDRKTLQRYPDVPTTSRRISLRSMDSFQIPTSKRGLKYMNALVDQGSDVNVMPLSTYMKLTDEKLAETDIRLSLASHSYVYPLGIVEDVLVEDYQHVYPIDFMILDIKEDENRSFILGTPFLTMTKAVIKFDKDTITLRSGKSKISFHRIPKSLCEGEKGIKSDIEPITPTMIVNRLVLEWEEDIKLHQEKEMEFDRWRNKTLKMSVMLLSK